jgi:hypothetical protein
LPEQLVSDDGLRGCAVDPRDDRPPPPSTAHRRGNSCGIQPSTSPINARRL